ncbi:Ras-related protein Rap [Acrasis kona]|uniref:Ras-related protein Rap n=1 Tax=Acrasis kona TaxID=1008807 RepID=A0AAW2Z9T9_9EUKA
MKVTRGEHPLFVDEVLSHIFLFMLEDNAAETLNLSSVCWFFEKVICSDKWWCSIWTQSVFYSDTIKYDYKKCYLEMRRYMKKHPLEKNTIKILVSGDTCVGKTSLIVTYIGWEFSDCYDPTLEDDYHKTIHRDGLKLKIEFIDFSGQADRYYFEYLYSCADAILFVYSLADGATLADGFSYCMSYRNSNKNAPIFIAANKCDIDNNSITLEQAQVYINSNHTLEKIVGDIAYTSAKTYVNVEETFNCIVRRVVRDRMNHDMLCKTLSTNGTLFKQKQKCVTS